MKGSRRRGTDRAERRFPRLLVGLVVLLLMAGGIGAVAMRSGEAVGGAESTEADASLEAGPQAEDGAGAGSAEDPAAGASAQEPASVQEPVPEPEPEVEWAAATDPSPVEPVPSGQRVPKPDAVRGIYVGAWTVGNAGRFDRLVRLADETEVNAFVIDVKDVTGEVSYASEVPLAKQVGATERRKIGDIRATLERLREHGIYPIARIVVFKDPLLATARPEWSIAREDGTIWEDNKGVHWVDSYNRNVWDYNIELAREAIALGFSEIQWDYIRFPDVPSSYMLEAVYPAREGRSKTDGIREFMAYTRERLADLDVPVTADVFGITTSTRRDIGIGQVWEKMSDVMDVLLPMVYPSHYPDGSWHYDNPNAAPFQIVKKAMDDAVERSLVIDNAAAIRPWLQAFSMGEPEYGPRHVRAQIDAVYAAGLTEWILWNPSVRYPREALATAEGVEPWFAGMGEALYEPELELPEPEVDVDDGPGRPLGTPVGRRFPECGRRLEGRSLRRFAPRDPLTRGSILVGRFAPSEDSAGAEGRAPDARGVRARAKRGFEPGCRDDRGDHREPGRRPLDPRVSGSGRPGGPTGSTPGEAGSRPSGARPGIDPRPRRVSDGAERRRRSTLDRYASPTSLTSFNALVDVATPSRSR